MSSTSIMKLLKCLMPLVTFPLDLRDIEVTSQKLVFFVQRLYRSCNSGQKRGLS